MDSKKAITNESFGLNGGSSESSRSTSGAFAFSEQLISTTTFLANGVSDVTTDKQFTISLFKLGNIVFCRIKQVVTPMVNTQWLEIKYPIRASLRPAAKTTQVFLPLVDIESYDSYIMGAVTISPDGIIKIWHEKLIGTGAWDSSACGFKDICMFWLKV